MQTEQAHSRQGSLRLGGARADFVAGLGRKVGDLRTALGPLRDKPEDLPLREAFRKKLQTLSAGARLMKFDAMDRAICEALGTIDRTAIDTPMESADLDAIEQVLEDLPALAWGEGPTRGGQSEEPPKVAQPTYGALVVGTAVIAEALLGPAAEGRPTFGCECTPDAQAAFDLARATEPDLVVLDADLPCAVELVEALMDDPVTETTPVVVVGSFLEAGECERYVVMGVAKTLQKPTNREALRAICEEAIAARRGKGAAHVALGEPTLNELGDRLAAELREALVGRVDPAARDTKIPLGEGSEVMGALWGAIARVREVVAARSDGSIRFFGAGPEGALPIAPLGDIDLPNADRARQRTRGTASDVSLEGRRIVVADDDPAVVWFMADLLKGAGCTVYETFDGEQALEAARRTNPDLVVSDILMPKLDGFSLCRAMRRDVALRDVPVILLSWKEDLLQRVRELGAGAAGYVRKETDTRAMLARIREALRARARIEARVAEDGEVRGRLDGVSVRTLLEIVCASRSEARVSVRDASFHYEVEIRWGAPQRATRTAGDGTLVRGPRVLAQMLGVGAGRFTVMNSVVPIEPELDGDLAAQLAKPIAQARAATQLLTGPDMMRVERVVFDEPALDDYLKATPDRARTLVRRMVKGAPPKQLVLEGACEASLLEDLVVDLAARGLVVSVEGAAGEDLMTPAVSRLAEPSGTRAAAPSPDACAADAQPLCSSPAPSGVASPSSLGDAVLGEVAGRSPQPAKLAQLALPLAKAAPRIEKGGTPAPEQIVALAEPTIIDDTVYAVKEAANDAANDAVQEDDGLSIRIEESIGTPLAAVTSSEAEQGKAATPPKRRGWSMFAFVAATAGVAWAVMHYSALPAMPRQVETAPPPAVTALPSAENDSNKVSYTPVAHEAQVADGQGMLDVSAPAGASVVVDGSERGHGTAKIPLAAGAHDVRIRATAGDDTCTVQVHAGRVAHVKF